MKPISTLAAGLCLCTLVAPLGAVQPQFAEVSIVEGSDGAATGKPDVRYLDPAGLARPGAAILGQGYVNEVEPNGTFATATPLSGSDLVIRGNVVPNADLDWFSFTAAPGDRLYAATMTSASSNGSSDSQLRLYGADGTTLIEVDTNDGSLGASSSTIANALLATGGTYFMEVRHGVATNQLRPYELHFRLQSGSPTPEVEANDTPGTANPLPVGGWVSGARNPAVATEQDWYSFTANAGDTIFLSLDLDPERDNVQWDGRLGIALFGDAGNQILVVSDSSVGSVANPLSEALFMTVKTAGTYYAFVDAPLAGTGGPTATYTLSVSIHPAADEGVGCTTYTSVDVPKTIGPAAGLVSSTIFVPGNPRIADIDVDIVLNHAFMQDIDAHLRSPGGNDIGLFTDIGSSAAPFQTQMDLVLDDEAAIPPTFTVLKGLALKPEIAYRLAWFDGEDAGGTWTLDLRDDANAASGGTLTSWSIRICEPPPPPACAPGFNPVTVFTTDFESGDAGFTHSGTQDEWELGLPATLATTTSNPVAGFTTCNSGTSCWKTDLDGLYNVTSTQDLLSPNLDLTGLSAPIVVTWAQRYQMESASFDHYFVDFQQAGGANPIRLFEHLDATMVDGVGSPTVNIPAASGWSMVSRRADSLAGLIAELRFHVDSDDTVHFPGAAIDDVTVTACMPAPSADLEITKTDGVTSATPGATVTYTIVASNNGPDPVVGASVTDTFPAALSCATTCTAAGGASCTAGPVLGDISDTVDLPNGGSATYTSLCSIDPSATGTLFNIANVFSAVADPTPGNNSATDNDTLLVPEADISISKTDGLTTAAPGATIVYTIVVDNLGPSDMNGVSVTDNLPAVLLSCSWTAVLSGGATGATSGSGDISELVDMPVTSSVTYTVTCTLDPDAFAGVVSNTATVTSGNDPNAGNNSATDTTDIDTNLLFADGFESGDTSLWSNTVPLTLSLARFGGAAESGAVTFTVDARNPGAVLVEGLTATRNQAWLLEVVTLSGGEVIVRIAAANDAQVWARTEPVSMVGDRFEFRLEWRRASFQNLSNGEIRLLANGAEVASIVGLDNARMVPREAKIGGTLELLAE